MNLCVCVCACVILQQEVKAALEQVCNMLPGDLKSGCTGLVDSDFDTIWSLLKQEIVSTCCCLCSFSCHEVNLLV